MKRTRSLKKTINTLKKNKEEKPKIDFIKESEMLYERIQYSHKSEWDLIRAKLYHERRGKCEITGEYIKHDNFEVHHIKPREFGGKNIENNLIIIKPNIHKELHRKEHDSNLNSNKKFVKFKEILIKYLNNLTR